MMISIILAAILFAVSDNLDLGIPGACDQIVDRRGFALGYSEDHEQPLWVSYRLTADEVTNVAATRTGRFWSDPEILTGSAVPSDYSHSGFDRGHLAPAGDMRFDRQAMRESFSMANISPQRPSFNRGVWKRLEEHIRSLAVREESLVVVSGPIFFTNTPVRVIGGNRVRVPDAFYKVVYLEGEPRQMLAFVLPHEESNAQLSAFKTSVDVVEEMTGLDFFSALPDDEEAELEATPLF